MHAPLALDPRQAALLCIDLQEEHRRDSRYFVEGYAAILANVAQLQETARRIGVRVEHLSYVIDPAEMRELYPVLADGSSAFSTLGDPLTAICHEVGPVGDEYVRVKDNASAFVLPGLETDLRALGISWLIVVGVWTEACIAATVRDAVDRGFRVALVKDACGSGSAAMHETGIINLANRLYGGAVVDTAAACRLIAGKEVMAWQVRGAAPLRYTFADAHELYVSL